jgi:hypothetical protein
VNQEDRDGHLEPHEVAAWTDGTLPGDRRATLEAHLAECAECRAEAADVSRIVRSLPRPAVVRRRVWIPAAAAAAAILLATWLGPRALRDPELPEPAEQHRQEAVTTTVAPRPLVPIGAVDRVSRFVWSSVPRAEGYRVRLFDDQGTVVWATESADTVVVPPDTLALRARRPYYWRVEAHTGVGRWVASDLVELVARRGGPP